MPAISKSIGRLTIAIQHLTIRRLKFESDGLTKQMEQQDAHILGFSVASWPRWLVLLTGAGGIFVCFLLHGIAHEHLIKHYKLKETFFLTFIQFMGYSALSFPTAINIIRGKVQLKASIWAYVATSLCLAFSMGLTNFAAVRLSFATGVLFKSSKLIPVMIGNVIFLKKKPKVSEAFSVILIVFGLAGISLGDFKGKNTFNISGVIAVSASLICGAIASNMEDKVMSHYGASQDELISMLYSIGGLIMCSMAIITGQMGTGLQKVMNEPSSLVFLLFFSILGALGIQFVYLTMKVFGSLITVMVTSVRKALTVCLSFLIFRDKVFTSWHAVSMLAITIGMTINAVEKSKSKKVAKEAIEEETKLLDNVARNVSLEESDDIHASV